MISNWTDISENEKQALLNEIPYPKYQLCPNVTSMIIHGGEDINSTSFLLSVYAQNQTVFEDDAECATIYVSEISRYFNVNDYHDNGYMNYITLSESTHYIQYAT